MQGEWHAFYEKPSKARSHYRAFGRMFFVLVFLEVLAVFFFLKSCGGSAW